MTYIPVLKFGGLTLQGRERFGPDEPALLEECRQLESVNAIYRHIETRRNQARAKRLREIAERFILPFTTDGVIPVVVVSAFDWTTDKLQQLAYCVHEEPDDREYARLLMSGELRANSALAMVLQCMDCPACSLTGHEAGINTTPQHVDALVRRVHAGYSRSLIERGVVPVIAGFQGYFHNPKLGRNDVSILGRGGSNLTAVALAHALGQSECIMFTDVDGIYDKDPRRHADARKLPQVKASDLLEWDPFPQVIQKEAVQFAVNRRVNIWIRDGFDADAPGSLIVCTG